MLKHPGVYAILCIPTDELYVGGTRLPIGRRFSVHVRKLRAGRSPSPLLQAAWDKYGEAAFEFIPLKTFSIEEVDKREREAIERLKPTLNLRLKATVLSDAALGYRKKIGLTGAALHAPPYMNMSRYQVGDEQLTLYELVERSGMSLSGIYKRIERGVTGRGLVALSQTGGRKDYARR